jgi:hypothetical protein
MMMDTTVNLLEWILYCSNITINDNAISFSFTVEVNTISCYKYSCLRQRLPKSAESNICAKARRGAAGGHVIFCP